MARGRKSGPTRLDLRKQNDAAEAREGEEVEKEDDEDEDEDEDDEEAEEEAADGDSDGEAEPADDDDEDAPKPKKSKAKAKAKKEPAVKKPAAKRTRAVKEVRMKAIWVVFDNSNKRLETFPYPQRAEADDFLAKKIEEKKGTFYIQLVKEPLE